MNVETRHYEATEPGPHLIVFGAIHGNEPKGTEAILRVCSEIENGSIELRKGEITFVPTANIEAFRANKRFLEEDLNRVFRKTSNPKSAESLLANDLCTLIDNADVLLDIHTTSAPGPSCVFIDFPTAANKALAAVVGAEYALLDWPKLYEQNEFFDSYDTTRYVFDVGKDGIIVETGQHEEPAAADRAFDVILRIATHLGLIQSHELPASLPRVVSISMTALYRKDSGGDHFTNQWDHLEPIPKDTVIALRADGTEISISVDSVMLLPKHQALAGEEWFYIGEII